MIAMSASSVDILHEPTVTSTNDRVLSHVAARGPQFAQPLALWADRQTAARGRLGRKWVSDHRGLWLSVAHPMRRTPQTYAATPLLVGLALRASLVPLLRNEVRLEIKWPNDLLVAGCKLAGILCEARPTGIAERRAQPGSTGMGWLVIGIGVNIESPQLPQEAGILPGAGLLEFAEHLPAPADLATRVAGSVGAVLAQLESNPGQTCADARSALQGALAYVGEPVRVTQQTPIGGDATREHRSEAGVLRGVTDNLELELERACGTSVRIAVGDVSRVRPVSYGSAVEEASS